MFRLRRRCPVRPSVVREAVSRHRKVFLLPQGTEEEGETGQAPLADFTGKDFYRILQFLSEAAGPAGPPARPGVARAAGLEHPWHLAHGRGLTTIS